VFYPEPSPRSIEEIQTESFDTDKIHHLKYLEGLKVWLAEPKGEIIMGEGNKK
jgi:hypothetical protein